MEATGELMNRRMFYISSKRYSAQKFDKPVVIVTQAEEAAEKAFLIEKHGNLALKM
jgi:hypothetical protein